MTSFHSQGILLCFCDSLLGKHVDKVHGRSFFFIVVRGLSH